MLSLRPYSRACEQGRCARYGELHHILAAKLGRRESGGTRRRADHPHLSALELSKQVQSRDVFDLKLLMDAGGAEGSPPAAVSTKRTTAISKAIAGQGLAFLESEYQEHYGHRKIWAELQEQVVDGLEALRP